MAKTIAFVNQKGGVGKTTSCVNLGSCLQAVGARVLVCDFDPQGNATSGFGVDKGAVFPTVYDVLISGAPVESAIVHTKYSDVLPANKALAGASVEMIPMERREYLLKDALAKVASQYDFILIDCPPSLELLTLNCLCAADTVLVPVQCEYYALEGLSDLLSTIRIVKGRLNPGIALEGLLLTMYDGRTNLSLQVAEEVKRHFPGKVFATVIPRNVRLSEAPSHGKPVNAYDGSSRGSVAYQRLTEELLEQAQTGGSVSLPIAQVEPGLNQPRKHFEEEALADLAESIRQHGMIQPLTVRRLASGYYQIIAGERRWRAARMAGLEEVPATIIEADDRKVMELGLIENLQREDLNPMEEAAGYRSLIQDYGLTQEEAAHRVSKSRPAVANAMRLLSLPQEVQWLIEQGNLSAGHGRALLSLPAPEEQIQFAGEIMEKGYSVRETEERIRQRLQAQDQPAQARPAPSPLRLYYKEAERQLTAGLGRRVTITQGKKKGKIALEYYDQEDLEGLMQALSALDTGKERRKP